MPMFMVRVEIIGAKSRADYKALHDEMAKEGFSRTATSFSGRTYHLPHAEYSITQPISGLEVLRKAKHAVGQTGNVGRILVSEVVTRCWSRLERVKP